MTKSPIWRTKSGKLISVNKMEDSHLLNTIRYIGKNNGSNEWLTILEAECIKRNLKVPKRPNNYQDWTQCDATESDIY